MPIPSPHSDQDESPEKSAAKQLQSMSFGKKFLLWISNSRKSFIRPFKFILIKLPAYLAAFLGMIVTGIIAGIVGGIIGGFIGFFYPRWGAFQQFSDIGIRMVGKFTFALIFGLLIPAFFTTGLFLTIGLNLTVGLLGIIVGLPSYLFSIMLHDASHLLDGE